MHYCEILMFDVYNGESRATESRARDSTHVTFRSTHTAVSTEAS